MNSSSLRIIFAGTPQFAATHLRGLLDSRHELVAVYTQPDRPAGRGKKLQASPVKQMAEAAGIAVFQPPSLRDEQAQQELARLGADVMVVVAYGLILPQQVLDAPRIACLNVHASLLPRWRGAAPIARAIEAGDTESGVTIMQMDAGLDTGNMLAIARCALDEKTTAASLHEQLAGMGLPLLLEVLDTLPEHLARGRGQDSEQATYASKILKPEAEIDWRESADTIARKTRAFNPFPISYTMLGDNRLKVHAAWASGEAEGAAQPGTILKALATGIVIACGQGQLHISRLQLPGGKALSTEQMLNAKSALFAPGTILGPSQGPVESA
ncbi:MAG: methionyl-tRNA formyltransferase [Proteobacteria bacterium]|nr:methionyl-tRNA formyltransferase [Pseudomonadota bacterium]